MRREPRDINYVYAGSLPATTHLSLEGVSAVLRSPGRSTYSWMWSRVLSGVLLALYSRALPAHLGVRDDLLRVLLEGRVAHGLRGAKGWGGSPHMIQQKPPMESPFTKPPGDPEPLLQTPSILVPLRTHPRQARPREAPVHLELHGEAADLVVVRATLQRREHSLVDLLRDVLDLRADSCTSEDCGATPVGGGWNVLSSE